MTSNIGLIRVIVYKITNINDYWYGDRHIVHSYRKNPSLNSLKQLCNAKLATK